jgi:hypothetical protein
MDPNETLRLIAAALRDARHHSAREHRGNLKDWLRRGGFAPDWSREPAAAKFCGVSDEQITKAREDRGAR